MLGLKPTASSFTQEITIEFTFGDNESCRGGHYSKTAYLKVIWIVFYNYR